MKIKKTTSETIWMKHYGRIYIDVLDLMNILDKANYKALYKDFERELKKAKKKFK